MICKPIYLTFSLFSWLLFSLSSAQAAELCGKSAQGQILLGRAPGTEKIIFQNKEWHISPQGEFLLALGRDDGPVQTLTLVNRNQSSSQLELQVEPTQWDIQNLKGVPPRKVTPSEADLRDIEQEQKLVRAAQKDLTDYTFWKNGFFKPVQGRISGNFGGQRIMNGIKKNPHGGMDIAAPEGTEVKAPAAGVVTLAAPDLFYSGNVIILDHGYGLHTIYAHLSQMNVKRGDKITQGQVIGLVGKTGRVTGPHLHWGASLNGTRFNPQSLLNISTINNFCFNL